MKIAIACHPTQGGSGIVATELATALAHRGHQVHLAATTRPYRLTEDSGVIFHPVQVPHYPLFRHPPQDLSLANKLAGITKEFGIDVIHAHYAVPHAITAILARQVVEPQVVKVVTTMHGTDITLVGSHAEFYDLTRHAMVVSDRLTAVSQWLSGQATSRFALPHAPQVVHNFIDAQRFSPAGRAPYPGPGEEFQILHASNLRPVKRVTDVVRVFERIARELPAHLTILGEGPEKGLAQELVSELDLCAKVTFTSTADCVPTVTRGAHLALLLSDYESFGLSALEAMACGTPVAASASGGLPEVIAHDRTGLLSPVGDVNMTAKQIIALLRDHARWQKMGAAAAAAAVERFGLEVIVPQYEELYAQTLNS